MNAGGDRGGQPTPIPPAERPHNQPRRTSAGRGGGQARVGKVLNLRLHAAGIGIDTKVDAVRVIGALQWEQRIDKTPLVVPPVFPPVLSGDPVRSITLDSVTDVA